MLFVNSKPGLHDLQETKCQIQSSFKNALNMFFSKDVNTVEKFYVFEKYSLLHVHICRNENLHL